MIDARLSVGFPTHPKTKKLIRRLGTDAAWRITCLFLWASQNRPDGILSGMDAEDIEIAVDWPGEDGVLVSALLEVGFIEEDGGVYSIHGWHEHNPYVAGHTARSEKARWASLCNRYGRQKAAEMMPEYAARHPVDKRDSSKSHLLDESRSSPSPSPYPYPSTDTEPLSESSTVGGDFSLIPPTSSSVAASKASKGSRLPDDWQLPKPWGDWALGERPGWNADDVRRIAEKFADHWRAQPGAKGRKADWQATWRNWVRNESHGPPARASPWRAAAAEDRERVSEILTGRGSQHGIERDITGEVVRLA